MSIFNEKYVFDKSLLNDLLSEHVFDLHFDDVTKTFPLPVSKITGILCGGFPISIIPIY